MTMCMDEPLVKYSAHVEWLGEDIPEWEIKDFDTMDQANMWLIRLHNEPKLGRVYVDKVVTRIKWGH